MCTCACVHTKSFLWRREKSLRSALQNAVGRISRNGDFFQWGLVYDNLTSVRYEFVLMTEISELRHVTLQAILYITRLLYTQAWLNHCVRMSIFTIMTFQMQWRQRERRQGANVSPPPFQKGGHYSVHLLRSVMKQQIGCWRKSTKEKWAVKQPNNDSACILNRSSFIYTRVHVQYTVFMHSHLVVCCTV